MSKAIIGKIIFLNNICKTNSVTFWIIQFKFIYSLSPSLLSWIKESTIIYYSRYWHTKYLNSFIRSIRRETPERQLSIFSPCHQVTRLNLNYFTNVSGVPVIIISITCNVTGSFHLIVCSKTQNYIMGISVTHLLQISALLS